MYIGTLQEVTDKLGKAGGTGLRAGSRAIAGATAGQAAGMLAGIASRGKDAASTFVNTGGQYIPLDALDRVETMGKAGAAIGGALGAGSSIYNDYKNKQGIFDKKKTKKMTTNQKINTVGRHLGKAGMTVGTGYLGAVGGTALGSLGGSLVGGPVGAAIGGALGSAYGGYKGTKKGEELGDRFFFNKKKKK